MASLRTLRETIYREASWRRLILPMMLIIPLNLLAFPLLTQHLQSLTAGMGTLDAQVAYSPRQALAFMQGLSNQARGAYLLIEWTADLIYPLAYASLFAGLIAQLLKSSLPAADPLRNLVLLPAAMVAADYAENLLVTLLLASYPHLLPGLLAALVALASFLKWFLGAWVISAILIALFFFIRRSRLLAHQKGLE
jgi:hypothetical protein